MIFHEGGLTEGCSEITGYIRSPSRDKGEKKPALHAQMRTQERQLTLWICDLCEAFDQRSPGTPDLPDASSCLRHHWTRHPPNPS